MPGVIQSEVVLIADKGDGGGKRWVYLDVGKFNGLAETMGESIKYRIEAPGRSGPPRAGHPRRPDLRQRRYPLRAAPSTGCRSDLAVGDKVEILSAGAYTASYASVGFNGFPPLRTYCI